MCPLSTAAKTETIRDQILDAARARFEQFGYNKTNMSEIAGDVDMSTANLYRYFENKLEIAASCAQRCLGDRLTVLRAVVDRTDLSAEQRLIEFVLALLRYTHEQTAEQSRIVELVDTIIANRQDIVHWKNKNELEMLDELIQAGIDSGEFDVVDVNATARGLHASLFMFGLPLSMQFMPLEQYEHLAREAASIWINGLKAH